MNADKQSIIAGLATLLERDLTPESLLNSDAQTWDSLCVVVTIGIIDTVTGRPVDGQALSECTTVAQVLALAGVDPDPLES